MKVQSFVLATVVLVVANSEVVNFFGQQGVDMFGNRIGFLKFVADVIDKETGKKVSNDNVLVFRLSLVHGIFRFDSVATL